MCGSEIGSKIMESASHFHNLIIETLFEVSENTTYKMTSFDSTDHMLHTDSNRRDGSVDLFPPRGKRFSLGLFPRHPDFGSLRMKSQKTGILQQSASRGKASILDFLGDFLVVTTAGLSLAHIDHAFPGGNQNILLGICFSLATVVFLLLILVLRRTDTPFRSIDVIDRIIRLFFKTFCISMPFYINHLH